ncbi:hypothetical protein V8C35DRAFT_112640 [Trichoderma chlorosporum]
MDSLPEFTWQQKALAAGRTPLPSSRPPANAHKMRIVKSGKTICESSSDYVKSEAYHALDSCRDQRRKWTRDEIRWVVRMRMNGLSWELIADAFPGRTVASIRQVYFKYRHKDYIDIEANEK